jgi:7-cyano-7-deazaguanine synthase
MKQKCVTLVSGGIDSVVTLALCSQHYDVYALSFDYGQKHAIELECAKHHTHKFACKEHKIIPVPLSDITHSALTDPQIAPQQSVAPYEIPNTYVPARNLILLSLAVAYAYTVGADLISYGANVVDYSNYPDCRLGFITAFNQVAQLATGPQHKPQVFAPLLFLSKSQIIKLGHSLGVDFKHTWSCYDPMPGPRPCGKCPSCQIRHKGFQEAGIQDPWEE